MLIWSLNGLQNADFSNVKGFTFTDKNGVKSTPLPPLFDMDLLPFPYGEEELSSGKILYYESSRGCPVQLPVLPLLPG